MSERLCELEVENAELRRRVAELEREATRDPLTGLLNRRGGEAALSRMRARHLRQGTPLSVLVLDLDRFKQVNDQHGHAAGDRALQQAARAIDLLTRSTDAAVRWGGEEFLVASENEPVGARVLAEKLRQAIAMTAFADERGLVAVTASIGVATMREKEVTVALLGRADAALYAAKQNGRDRVEVSP